MQATGLCPPKSTWEHNLYCHSHTVLTDVIAQLWYSTAISVKVSQQRQTRQDESSCDIRTFSVDNDVLTSFMLLAVYFVIYHDDNHYRYWTQRLSIRMDGIWLYLYRNNEHLLCNLTLTTFSCYQAALWMVFSVRLSVCHTFFFTMFPLSYHHEIFRRCHHGPGLSPCKRARSEVKGKSHRGHNPT